MNTRFLPLLTALAGLLPATAETLVVDTDFDRWMYGVNQTPGVRPLAPTFSDNSGQYLGQFLVGFSGALVPAGTTAGQIRLNSVRVILENGNTSSNAFTLDTSYDDNASILDGSAYADGIPVELFGVGYRGGFTAETFAENSPYGGAGGANAFAIDFDAAGNARDVTEAVGSFERNPLAIGFVEGLADGSTVSDGDSMSFEADLSQAAWDAYLRQGLAEGRLRLMVGSLHAASQPGVDGPSAYPQWYAREDALSSGARLIVDYDLIPEPGAALLALLGGLPLARRRR